MDAKETIKERFISAAGVDQILQSIPTHTDGERTIITVVHAWINSCQTIANEPDIISLHRCPVCQRFPLMEYDYNYESPYGLTGRIKLRCECPVGIVTEYLLDYGMSDDIRISLAVKVEEHHWNRLVEERTKKLEEGTDASKIKNESP